MNNVHKCVMWIASAIVVTTGIVITKDIETAGWIMMIPLAVSLFKLKIYFILEGDLMINIQDVSLLKITKVIDWSILFDYDGKHYLLHGTREIGEPDRQELYERNLNQNGKYDLEYKNSCYGTEYVSRDYIKSKSSKTIVYNQIDKDFFAYKLTKRGFAEGIMEDKVQYENDRIDKIKKQIRIFEYKISELRRTIQDYI